MRWLDLGDGWTYKMAEPRRWLDLEDGCTQEMAAPRIWLHLGYGWIQDMAGSRRWLDLGDGWDQEMAGPRRWLDLGDGWTQACYFWQRKFGCRQPYHQCPGPSISRRNSHFTVISVAQKQLNKYNFLIRLLTKLNIVSIFRSHFEPFCLLFHWYFFQIVQK